MKKFRLDSFPLFLLARHSPKKIIAAVKVNAPTAWSGGCVVPNKPASKPDCQTATFIATNPSSKKSVPNIL